MLHHYIRINYRIVRLDLNDKMKAIADKLNCQGKLAQTCEAYQQAIHSNSDLLTLLSAYNNQAFAFQELECYAESADAYSKLMQLDPDFQKGIPYGLMAKQYQLADAYKNLMELNPEFWEGTPYRFMVKY